MAARKRLTLLSVQAQTGSVSGDPIKLSAVKRVVLVEVRATRQSGSGDPSSLVVEDFSDPSFVASDLVDLSGLTGASIHEVREPTRPTLESLRASVTIPGGTTYDVDVDAVCEMR